MHAKLLLRLTSLLSLFSASAMASILVIPPPSLAHPADQNPTTSNSSCEHTESVFRCVKVHYNYDGDTMMVSIANVHPLLGQKVSVRVHGIDAPEMHASEPCERAAAVAAQQFVKEVLLRAKRIDLERVQRDKYFRILADVRADGESIAQMLIAQGLAYPYYGGTKQRIDWCSR
ncbi:MAG: thermonuclease family protein [Silvanigrellaceae bacterium]